MKKRVLIWLAIASLLGAFLYARLTPGPDLNPILSTTLNAGETLGQEATTGVWEVRDSSGNLVGHLSLGTASGYGGPLTVATRVDTDGKVVSVHPVTQKESPGFFNTVVRSGYLEQFERKGAGSNFQVGQDIDGVSGATITSRALANAVSEGAHLIGRKVLGVQVPQQALMAEVGMKEWALLGMLALSALLFWRNWTKLRLPLLVLSTVVMGFWLGSLFAVPQLTTLVLGYAPPLRESLHWYILVVGVLALSLLLGKGWYCYWLCPFGAVQELLSFVGKGLIQPSARMRRLFAWVRWAILWASAMVGFLTLNPGAGSVEPFGTLFMFKGSNAQWALLFTILLSAMFLPRFWCNYLCPAGTARDLIEMGRREVLARWKRRKSSKSATS